jgi:hypothetical protein
MYMAPKFQSFIGDVQMMPVVLPAILPGTTDVFSPD